MLRYIWHSFQWRSFKQLYACNIQASPLYLNSRNASPYLCRQFSTSNVQLRSSENVAVDGTESPESSETENASVQTRRVVDVETSIRYLNSNSYKITYKGARVWEPYRRNHKGQIPPEKTRKSCYRGKVIATGNPCPICRDEYLVLHPENVDLLKQFIRPETGEVFSFQKTGLCQQQHQNLLVALNQAWDLGYLEMVLPFRRYDYAEFYSNFEGLENMKGDNDSHLKKTK